MSKKISTKQAKPQAVKPQPVKNSTKDPQTMDELMAMGLEKKLSVKKRDTVEGTVINVSSKEILFDIGMKSYGVLADWEMKNAGDLLKTIKVGDKMTAQVISPENDMGYIVLSIRKASQELRWDKLYQAKDKGEDITVTGLEQARGGLLVDVNGLRGFVPSTQFDQESAGEISSFVNKKLKVKVIEVDKAANRLVLSQKASKLGVTPKLQKEKLEKIKPNDVIKGTISGVAPFGVFVDIDGLEGLVHISELAWEKVEDPSSLYMIGDEVEVMVLEVNTNEGKLNLSVKRLTPDPWKNILDRYPVDSNVSGEVMRSAAYGYFVKLEPGVEGLIHISKVTPGEEPKNGQQVECIVEKIDPAKRKISLTFIPKEKPIGYR